MRLSADSLHVLIYLFICGAVRCRAIPGGITLLFKSRFNNAVTIDKLTKNFLWCHIDKSVIGLTKDLYLCGLYIPPEKSTCFQDAIFDNLEGGIAYFSKRGNVMLLGDFNGRTGKLDDSVSKEGNNFISNVSENSSLTTLRENLDSTIKNHGKRLIELYNYKTLT